MFELLPLLGIVIDGSKYSATMSKNSSSKHSTVNHSSLQSKSYKQITVQQAQARLVRDYMLFQL